MTDDSASPAQPQGGNRRHAPIDWSQYPDDSNLVSQPFERIVSRLEHYVAHHGLDGPLPCDDGLAFTCPVHVGGHANMTVTDGDDGVLVRCHAYPNECTHIKIMEAIGLAEKDLFPQRQQTWLNGRQQAKRLPRQSIHRKSQVKARRKIEVEAPPTRIDWGAMHQMAQADLEARPRYLDWLAEHWGVPVEALQAIGIGWIGGKHAGEYDGIDSNDTIRHMQIANTCGKYVFPEYRPRTVEGRTKWIVSGLVTRIGHPLFVDLKWDKAMVPESTRGLTIPRGFWTSDAEEFFILEGQSDTAALIADGKMGVGRPGAQGGAQGSLGTELLIKLFRDDPQRRPITVIGERDEYTDKQGTTRWPGNPTPIADYLAMTLGREFRKEVHDTLPPKPHKD